MKDVTVSDVRTFALLGHTASGKTTLIDALLYKIGVNDRQGSVDTDSSMADYTDEEKGRKITIHAKSFGGVYSAAGRKYGMVMCDTPGFMDFFGQVILATRAVESAVVLVDAHSGLQVGSHRAWKQTETMKMPRAIVISGLDRENASFEKTLAAIQAAWGPQCLPVTIPQADLKGVADILSTTAPADQAEARTRLMEVAAETDDALIEKFLGGELLTADELASGLKKAFLKCSFVPVFACAAPKNLGITELLNGITRIFPSPLEKPMVNAEGKPVAVGPEAPFVGYVWRTVNDPFMGQLTFVRICGGTLRSDLEAVNVTREGKERMANALEVNGRKQTALETATAGDIVALAKLKNTKLGDALCAAGTVVNFAPLAFPHPVIWQSVVGKTQADEDKIGTALARITDDDPTLHVERNTDTHETILSGAGDVQLAVAVERMKKRSNVEVVLSTPKVPYKETVTARGEGHYKHKKQTGGRGQYGEVYLRIQPRPSDDEEWFDDAVVGGVIPGNFMPAIQKGFVEGMTRGPLAGCPVTNVKISVYDGSYHDVDSSEIAFKIAGARALKDGMMKAKPVLLEPIMTVRITVPDQFMGDVNGDLSHRRGRVIGMESDEGHQVILAEAPQAEMFRYCAELRSMTGGKGSFDMSFARYDIVPSNIAQKIIAEAAKHKQEEEE